MTTEQEETKVFDALWNKYEPLAKHMFQSTIEMLTDATVGRQRNDDQLTDLTTMHFALLNAYDKAMVAAEETDKAAMTATLGDFNKELPDE